MYGAYNPLPSSIVPFAVWCSLYWSLVGHWRGTEKPPLAARVRSRKSFSSKLMKKSRSVGMITSRGSGAMSKLLWHVGQRPMPLSTSLRDVNNSFCSMIVES